MPEWDRPVVKQDTDKPNCDSHRTLQLLEVEKGFKRDTSIRVAEKMVQEYTKLHVMLQGLSGPSLSKVE